MSDNIKSKMIGTLAWTSIDRFGQQLMQLAVGITLARLLSPSDYSLIALVMIFISLSNTLVDGGFGVALVRKQNASELDFNTVFYFNISVSAFLYLLLFFIAPFISSFYKVPELTLVARVVFLAIFFNAFFLIPNVKLAKALDFKKSAFVNIFAVVLSGAAGIVAALSDFGVWALVIQQLAFPFFRVFFVSFIVHWKPRFEFSFQVIRGFWNYSVNLLATSVLNNVFSYAYILVLGKFYPKHELGLYFQANKLNESVNFSFQAILGNTYHVFVKIQDDTERFKRIYRELIRHSSLLILPLLLLLVAIADPLINTLLTTKWAQAVPYFQLLCLASLFNSMYTITLSALNARGKSRATFNVELLKKIVIIGTIILFFNSGIQLLLIGFVVANWLSAIVSVFMIKQELKHFWKHQLADVIPSLIIGLIVGIAAYSLTFFDFSKFHILVAQLVISTFTYLVLVRVFYPSILKRVTSWLVEKFNSIWRRNK